jgi:hypothetical protein
VWIGNGGLFQIIVDAAAAALVTAFTIAGSAGQDSSGTEASMGKSEESG